MTLKPVNLITERSASNEASIKLLAELLDEAKDGRIVGLAVAIVRPDSHVNCTFTDFDNAGLMLGSVALLQSRLINNMAPK